MQRGSRDYGAFNTETVSLVVNHNFIWRDVCLSLATGVFHIASST